MLQVMNTAQHSGLALFGAEITPATVLRLGWIIASASLFLLQISFFSSLRG
jgi:hypothetical protein